MKQEEEKVVLVDEQDRETGIMGKWEAHTKGLLHRAVSVIVFDSTGQMLLQRRALTKYHTPGLWSNTCCSHPRQGETPEDAAHRRLREEMGFETRLDKKFIFTYKAHFDNGLIEHEVDHLFTGIYDDDPVINPKEVHEFKWMDTAELINDMELNPVNYTAWFRIIMGKIRNEYPELIHL